MTLRKLGKFRAAMVALLAALAFLPLVRAAESRREGAELAAMLGQMVMVGFRGTGEEPLTPDLHYLLEDIEAGKVGGVVLFEPDYTTRALRNIKSAPQVRRLTALLQANATIPLFVAVDQEGGRVRRFRPRHGFPDTPSAREMGKLDPETTRQRAAELGAALAAVGVNLDFAPALDVDVDPNSPAIGALERAFSADPAIVAEHGRAFAEGLWSEGVLFCYKHFPGHGSAAADSHAGFTDIGRTWSRDELEPYRRLLDSGMPGMVMIGHLTLRQFDPRHPSSLSYDIIAGLLRNELGWDGVVITDDMQMQAIAANYGEKEALALAVNAGVDVILVGSNLRPDPQQGRKVHSLLLEALEEGAITPERVRESYRRIMRLKARLSAGSEE